MVRSSCGPNNNVLSVSAHWGKWHPIVDRLSPVTRHKGRVYQSKLWIVIHAIFLAMLMARRSGVLMARPMRWDRSL